MHNALRRFLLLTVIATLTLLLAAAPASAAAELAGEDPAGADQQEDPDHAPAEDAPAGDTEHGDDGKSPLPLDLTDPYGWFGAFLIIILLGGGGFALHNARVQLRGERDQADGSWRWR